MKFISPPLMIEYLLIRILLSVYVQVTRKYLKFSLKSNIYNYLQFVPFFNQHKMMELSHSLTLNEDALAQIAEPKRPVFVFEWLRFLDKVLIAAQKVLFY